MSDIAKQLAEIEQTAQAIIDGAEVKKHEIEEKFQARRDNIDNQINKETQETIRILNEEIEKKTEQEVALKREENEKAISYMRKQYDECHREYAENILKKIIEV